MLAEIFLTCLVTALVLPLLYALFVTISDEGMSFKTFKNNKFFRGTVITTSIWGMMLYGFFYAPYAAKRDIAHALEAYGIKDPKTISLLIEHFSPSESSIEDIHQLGKTGSVEVISPLVEVLQYGKQGSPKHMAALSELQLLNRKEAITPP